MVIKNKGFKITMLVWLFLLAGAVVLRFLIPSTLSVMLTMGCFVVGLFIWLLHGLERADKE